MMDNIFDVFDAWEPLEKARKAKGLSKWDKLKHVAHKLDGKSKKEITYTCSHPSHKGDTHVLGSVVGNLHFLMGYGNPGFHMASYHWQVIDPGVEDEQADELQKLKGHPSRPELWKASGLPDNPEGDLAIGMPHPMAVAAQEQVRRESEGIRVASGAGMYLAVPSEGLVYGEHNKHIYKWDIVKDSFMAATNPSLVEAMDVKDEEESEKSYGPEIPEMIKHRLSVVQVRDFDDGVYDLVKSIFPSVGSVIPLITEFDNTIYGIVKSNSLDFYEKDGTPATLFAYGAKYSSMDLLENGDIHPSILFNFAVSYLDVDKSLATHDISDVTDNLTVVKGYPTPGFENIDDANIENMRRKVMREGNTYSVVLVDSNE